MKKSLILSLLLGFLALSCKEKDDTNPTTDTEGNYITMKIDGVEWKANTSIAGGIGILSDAQFIIAGGNSDSSDDFAISIENVTATGSYSTSDAKSYATFYRHPADDSKTQFYESKQDGKFTINITKASKTAVSGTFSGTLEVQAGNNPTPIHITDGKFNYAQ